jgi:hypothetical protein
MQNLEYLRLQVFYSFCYEGCAETVLNLLTTSQITSLNNHCTMRIINLKFSLCSKLNFEAVIFLTMAFQFKFKTMSL